MKETDVLAWFVFPLVVALACMTFLAFYAFHACTEAQEKLGRLCVAGMKEPDSAYRADWDLNCK